MTDRSQPALLVLVRHAESIRNVAKGGGLFFPDDAQRAGVRGLADHATPLTERGHAQARLTGRGLRETYGAFDCLYHSGYARTVQTADEILAAYPPDERRGIVVRDDLFIRERDTGHTYDMTTAEARTAFPWLQEYWDTYGSLFARPPGGESIADVAQRVHLFLDILARDHAGQRILVVTHGGTIRAFRFLLERWTYEEAAARFRDDAISNCGITTYRSSAGGTLELAEPCPTFWTSEME